MRPTLLLFLGFFCCAALLPAQIFGPVAKPVDQNRAGRGSGPLLALDLHGGMNFAARRRPAFDRIAMDGLDWKPGYLVGMEAILKPARSASLVIGFGGLLDRGLIEGYGKSSTDNFDSEDIRTRLGTVTFQEHWLRGYIGMRFGQGKINFLTAFAVSGIVAGTQQYDYVQTTTAFFDPVTGRVIPLDEPLVSTGSRDIRGSNSGGYASFLLGTGYVVSDQMRIQLSYDMGIHFQSSYYSLSSEWRHRRGRLSLNLSYRLLQTRDRRVPVGG